MGREPKFTPGPWFVFEERDHSGLSMGPRYDESYFTNGEVKAVCSISGRGRAVNDTERANARLVAAAPDLYEALKQIAACQIEFCEGLPAGFGPPVLSAEQMATLAFDALSKAEGK